MKEKKMNKLFGKISIPNLIWIFIIGSIFGYFFEIVWYFIRHHVWVNKQGLLYGPFQPIYGFGAVILSIFLQPVRNQNNVWVFLYGMLVGSIYEYLASLFQEIAFGTYTWIYSQWGWSLNGRIYLPYCIAWGILALFWIKLFYPMITKWLDKIPRIPNLILVWVLGIFLTYNLAMSSIVTYRYSARANNIPASNAFTKWIDKHYDDEFMQHKFIKLRVIQK